MALPLPLPTPTPSTPTALDPRWPELLAELQARGLRWLDEAGAGLARVGGAGPSDHKAVTLAGETVMVPIFTHEARRSPFAAVPGGSGRARLYREGRLVAELGVPRAPRFYARSTADGIPYWKLATLHGADVLATTVLQTCTRYGDRATACQFCAIGRSLAAHATVPQKTPEQLEEVARAAVELDGVRHAVLTTGTPATPDRGARLLAECTQAIRAAVELPVQVQCEPPDDLAWLARLREAGAEGLGMHLEAVTDEVRRRIMPGKAEVPLARYLDAFGRAVELFGRGQVSTYILAGLGDTREAIVSTCAELVAMGVYPFVVPFVPLAGTPLEHHPAPTPELLEPLLAEVAALLAAAGMRAADARAGCARCGACSSLRAREALRHA